MKTPPAPLPPEFTVVPTRDGVTVATQPTPKAAPTRLAQLDFLRAMAILFVLAHHMFYLHVSPGHFSKAVTFWMRFGWTGVDLFFVLSGFLIGGLLFKEIRTTGGLRVGRFLMRRGFKIWPLYYGFLLVCVPLLVKTTGEGLGAVMRALSACFLNVANFDFARLLTLSERNVFVAHLWSLGVEEHFYVGLPLLLLVLIRCSSDAKTRIKGLPTIGFSLMVVCLIGRLWLFLWKEVPMAVAYQTQWRIDSLFAGVLLAYAWHYHRESLRPIMALPGWLVLVASLFLLPMMVYGHELPATHSLGYTLLYMGYGLVTLAVMGSTEQKGALQRFFASRFARSVAAVGAFSYPIYLFHMLCFSVVDWFFSRYLLSVPDTLRWAMAFVACLGLSVAVGAGLSLVLEKPLLSLRNRLLPA